MIEPLHEDIEEEEEDNLVTDYAWELRQKLRTAHEHAREVLGASAKRPKKNYDRRAHGDSIEEGAFVWLYISARKPGTTNKLRLPWDGPYLVVQKLSDVHVRIQKSAKSKSKVVHVDHLKPYAGPPLQPWKYSTIAPSESSPMPTVTETESPVKDKKTNTDATAVLDPEDQAEEPNDDKEQDSEPDTPESLVPEQPVGEPKVAVKNTLEEPDTPVENHDDLSGQAKGSRGEEKLDPKESETAADNCDQGSHISKSDDNSHSAIGVPAADSPVKIASKQKPDNNGKSKQSSEARRNPARNRRLPARYRLNELAYSKKDQKKPPSAGTGITSNSSKERKIQVYRIPLHPQFSCVEFLHDTY
jgi:hypothetical protein